MVEIARSTGEHRSVRHLELLPLRVIPFPDESLRGLIVRLAERNAFERVGWITELAELNSSSVNVSNCDLRKLAKITEIPVSDLSRMRCEIDAAGTVTFRGQKVERPHLYSDKRRVCPDCLRDAPYSRRCWDLASVHICAEHKIRLVKKCEGCQKSISWNRPWICVCSCGFDFRESVRIQVDEDQVVATRLLIHTFENGVNRNLPEPLNRLGYSQLIELFLVLYSGVLEKKSAPERRVYLNNPDLFIMLQIGFELTQQWPKNFHELLDQIRLSLSSRRGVYGLQSNFGGLYHSITSIEDQTVSKIVHVAFRDYVRDNGDIGLSTRRSIIIRPEDRQTASHLTTKEAAAQLGITPMRVARLVEAGILEQFGERRGRGKPVLITTKSVRDYERRPHALINRDTAMKELGVGRKVFDNLVKVGIIKRHRQPSSDMALWLVDGGDIVSLLQRLEQTCQNPGPLKGAVSLESAAKSLFGVKCGVADMIRFILDGNLSVFGIVPDRKGLARLFIDSGKLRELLQSIREKIPYVSAHEFARLTGMHHDSVALLVQAGFITNLDRNAGKRAHYRINACAIDEFNERYVAGPRLAEELGTSSRDMQCLLQAYDIEPVASPTTGTSRTVIYERSDRLKTIIGAYRTTSADLRSIHRNKRATYAKLALDADVAASA